MKKNIFFFFQITLLFLCRLVSAAESQKPNLLFIITDQQRFDALAKAGVYPFLKTPNLDRIANEGAWFTNAYAPCAVCAPSRTSILTGQTIENHGVKTNDLAYNNSVEASSFDQVLSVNGYYCEYWGKFHSPIHLADAYQEFAYTINNNGRYTLADYARYKALLNDSVPEALPENNQFIDPTFFRKIYTPTPIDMRFDKSEDYRRIRTDNGKEMDISQPDCHGRLEIPSEFSLTRYQTQCGIEGIKRAAQQNKPFSITVSYFFPHAPMLPTLPWSEMYDLEAMPIPPSIHDPMENTPYEKSNSRLHMPEYRDKDKIRYMMQAYFGLVSEIDSCVGALLNELNKNGFSENTLVIFTSDHGEMLGSHGMREKNVFYEESSHIPLLIWSPQKINPVKVDAYVSLIDLFPTIMDYLAVESEPRDGQSLRDLIEANETDHGNFVVTEWDYNGPGQPNYMVVSDGWKLLTSYGNETSNTHALYNLIADPYEMNNLIGTNPKAADYATEAEVLRKYLVEWLEKSNSKRTEDIRNREIIAGHVPTSVSFGKSTHSPNLKVTPSVAFNYINVENNVNKTTAIFNVEGKKIAEFISSAGKNTIDIKNWNPGLYIVSSPNEASVKFLKK
tara:strand:+ start:14172 stop:16025 length:1854 start_codon:yes stop_codon:yes gene_type:complete